MRTLRFHRELYTQAAVDEAVRVFAPYATFELGADGEHVVVTLRAADPARERRVAGEVGNYALGLTVRARGGAA